MTVDCKLFTEDYFMINDKKMLEALRRGEKGTLRRFYKETQPKLWQWVVSRVQNEQDADEIVQDSFLNLLDSLPIFQGKSSLWTFLVSIAKHEVYDYWRKKYAKKAILTIPFADHIYTEKLYRYGPQTGWLILLV